MKAAWMTVMMISAVGLGGCFGPEALKQASSGLVGCPSSEIEISNDTPGFNQRAWDATCRGHLYHCAGVDRGGFSCTEDSATATTSKPATTSTTRVTSVGLPRAQASSASDKPAVKHAWHRVRARGCDATVLLPGAPVEQQETTRTRSGDVTTHTARVDMGDSVVSVACSAYPSKGTFDATKVVDGLRDRLVEDLGATIDSEEDRGVGDYDGRDVRFTVGGDRGRLRFLIRGREVVLLSMTPVTSFTSPEIRAFFEAATPTPTAAPDDASVPVDARR